MAETEPINPTETPNVANTEPSNPTNLPSTQPNNKKRKQNSNNKKKNKKKTSSHRKPPQTTLTLRKPEWAYIHLQHHLLTPNSSHQNPRLDALTVQLHLTSALSQFLGLHGAAMQFDILQLREQDVWIRLRGEDRVAFVAAVGGWRRNAGEGWRVVGWSSWDARVGGGGQDLFAD